VYLASAQPLPVIGWSKEHPAFNAGPLEPFEESVRPWLSLPYLASLGAHTSCGCGFLNDGAEDVADVRASREGLAAYANAALRAGPVELYVCWNGDAEESLVQQLEFSVQDLIDREDWLEEGTHVRLIPQAA
jgi:hypothetical protein